MRSIRVLVVVLALLLPAAAAAEGEPHGRPQTLPPSVPLGFAVTPAATVLAPTALSFAPDGETLYVASFAGQILAYPVLGGAALGVPTTFLDGVNTPLGVLATDDGVFVSGVEAGDGAVFRARDTTGDGQADEVETVLGGLPIGRHNTNGIVLGPDGMLYIANGNSTDSGFGAEGGPPEVPPYSGSVLRVDPLATDLTPTPDMVVATGWRNIYDLAFVPDGHPAHEDEKVTVAVPENGPDGMTYGGIQRPLGEDTLSIFEVRDGVVPHFGFPWCLYDRDRGGLDGFTQDPEEGLCDPLTEKAREGFPEDTQVVRAKPVALFGMNVSANGLDFNPGTNFPAAHDHDLFVAQWGSLWAEDVMGHKVVRVTFDDTGDVTGIEDFLTGAFPLGLRFGPDGAMWVADFGGAIYRVSSVLGSLL